MARFLERALAILARFEAVAIAGSSVGLILIMVISVVDVTLRYLFRAPIPWAFELISDYLMVGVFFLAVSETQRMRQHIAVDLLVRRLTPRWRSAAALFGSSLTVILFAWLFWVGTARTWEAWSQGLVKFGAVPWPKWISLSFLPLGIGLFVPRLVLQTLGELYTVLTDDDRFTGGSFHAPPPHGKN